jgi:histidine ammonia-lyase
VPALDEDRHLHPDIETAMALVRSDAVVLAAGSALLPTVA